MNTFSLKNEIPSYTVISNFFIDHIMPEVNGEYVKVYLLLLRYATGGNFALSLSQVADVLDVTEKDVRRALIFWKKKNLLSLEQEADGTIKTLRLLSPQAGAAGEQAGFGDLFSPAVGQTAPTTAPTAPAAPATAATPTVTAQPVQVREPVKEQAPSFKLSDALIKDLRRDEAAKQLLFVAETYLGRPLSPKDIRTLLFCYHDLQFSTDLLEYLIEYCVSRQKTDAAYMQKVAANWYQEGITTVAQARDGARHYQLYYPILKAFGIKNREPVRSEMQYIDCWSKDWGFDQEIIIEACERTIAKTHNPSFEYADRILKDWRDRSVTSKDDIEQLDRSWKEKNERHDSGAKQGSGRIKTPTSRFNNFESRQYEKGDLTQLLQQPLA
ncbi:MAG: DnaD domain protein [Eubacteriales bacterium]|nr:DnaD domain protein [Eubacteriales bacterium]